MDWSYNVQQLGDTFVFLLLWVSTWGLVEYTIDYFSTAKHHRFLIYTLMIIGASCVILFNSTPDSSSNRSNRFGMAHVHV